jgi:hypothetical protein
VDRSWEYMYKSLTGIYMNAEIGTEAAQSPEKEYINEIFISVWKNVLLHIFFSRSPRGRLWGRDKGEAQ